MVNRSPGGEQNYVLPSQCRETACVRVHQQSYLLFILPPHSLPNGPSSSSSDTSSFLLWALCTRSRLDYFFLTLFGSLLFAFQVSWLSMAYPPPLRYTFVASCSFLSLLFYFFVGRLLKSLPLLLEWHLPWARDSCFLTHYFIARVTVGSHLTWVNSTAPARCVPWAGARLPLPLCHHPCVRWPSAVVGAQ